MTKRFRLRFTFWLDMLKEGEAAVAEAIEKLKADRLFAQTVRDGIRLICDLRDGKLDVLFELFPWVRAEFLQYMREVASDGAGKDTSENRSQISSTHLEAERAWLEAEQERMEQERAWEQRRLEEAQKALEAERRAIEQERQRMEAERTASQSAIQQQLARLETLLLSQGHQPINSPTHVGRGDPPQNNAGPRQLSVQKIAAPTFDDDEDEDILKVKKDQSGGKQSAQNFLKSVMSLNEEPSKPPQNSHVDNTKSRRKRSQEIHQ